ncbi:G-protein coupled receptor moody-like [Panulirus ornatus]|uniref:G-protein coupled receptor moody-like n=1 Tax=Panulirus ornatus TaxID=150431 RepID=UPI003A83B345
MSTSGVVTLHDNTAATDAESFSPAAGWAMVLTGVLTIIISILGFFGNLLTILALTYSHRLRNATTYLVVNLSVSDGFICVVVLPGYAIHQFVLYTKGETSLTDGVCGLLTFLRYLCLLVSLLSIAAIALNRCVLISAPKTYPKLFTVKRTAIIIASMWLLTAIIMLIPALQVYGRFGYNDATDECDFVDDTEAGQTPRNIYMFLGFLLPCLVIVCSYTHIFYKACQSSARVRLQTNQSLTRDATSPKTRHKHPVGLGQRDIRLARTIGVIFLVLLACCIPVSVLHFVNAENHMPTLLLLMHPLYWLQSCLNIVIYIFMNRQYRIAYINYITRWWPSFSQTSKKWFKWKEETSDSQSLRAGTPTSATVHAINTVKNNPLERMSSSPMGTPVTKGKEPRTLLNTTL